MFENLNPWELGLLLLLALLIFGDKLPKVIGDGLRILRNVRSMANNATSDLSRELGTDIKLEDLHPKAFIRKHLLSEEEEAELRKPLQGMYDSLRADITGVQNEFKDIAAAADIRSALRPTSGSGSSGTARVGGGSAATTAAGSSGAGPVDTTPASPGPVVPASREYDIDAT